MKRFFAVGILAALLTLFTPSPANAEEGCVINVLGIKVCGTLVGVPLPPVVTVTVKPDPIRIPGPTVTLPPIQGPVVPGPTTTVTIPGATETVTAQPNTVGPSALPTEQPTATVTETGQPSTTRGTVTASPEPEVRTNTETRTKTETIVRNVAIGALVTLALALLGIIALFVGYYLGHKDAEKQEENFLGKMLDYAKTGKRPD